MQYRQHGAIRRGIQELVGVPRCGKRPGLRLAVTDHARHHETRIVEYRAERVAQRVTEFAALVDGPGTFGRRMAGNPAGE